VTPAGIELRYVTEPPVLERMKTREHAARAQVWMRANGSLPDDPLLHVCLVTYASDMTLLDAVLMRHGLSYDTDKLSVASLDHAMWFHAPFRADEWFLYDQESPWAGGARGLGRGTIYSCDGRLVVSVVQEGLIRIGPRPERRITAGQ
jgi:acyl-CoA thioesterase-2